MTADRVEIPRAVGRVLAEQRRASGVTNRELCASIGIKQPVTFYAWEQGRYRPTQPQFDAYLRAVGADTDVALALVDAGSEPTRTHVADAVHGIRPQRRAQPTCTSVISRPPTSNGSPAARTSNSLRNTTRMKPRSRQLEVDEDLLSLLGFYLAEGSCSDRNGIRLSIGRGNRGIVDEMAQRMRRVFGLVPSYYETTGRAGELKLVNRVAALAWQQLFGFAGAESHTKRIPDLVFNVPEALRLAFLRGYLLWRRHDRNGPHCVRHVVL